MTAANLKSHALHTLQSAMCQRISEHGAWTGFVSQRNRECESTHKTSELHTKSRGSAAISSVPRAAGLEASCRQVAITAKLCRSRLTFRQASQLRAT